MNENNIIYDDYNNPVNHHIIKNDFEKMRRRWKRLFSQVLDYITPICKRRNYTLRT